MIIYRLYYLNFFFAGAILITYFARHCENIGVAAAEIGLILGVRVIFSTTGQLIWSYIADRFGRAGTVLKVVGTASAVASALIFFARTPASIAAALWLHALFASARMPLFDTLVLLDKGASGYGRLRLFGSIGYGAGALLFGLLLTSFEQIDISTAFCLVLVIFETSGALISFRLPASGRPVSRVKIAEISRVLRNPQLLLLLTGGMLHWMTNIPYNYYLSILLERHYSAAGWAGSAIAIGIVGEVIGLKIAAPLFDRFGRKTVVIIAGLITAVRWLMTAQPLPLAALIILQLAHLATFGIWYAGLIAWLTEIVPDRLRSTGQTLMMIFVFQAGGAAANMVAGFLLDSGWSIADLFIAAGLVAAVAVFFIIPLPHNKYEAKI